jgi:predicted lysophospholipase L1 biosynthesis ABC-type transport system permease subunit
MRTKSCPHCRDAIRAEAKKCQLCGFRFDVPAVAWPRKLSAAGAFPIGSAIALVVFALAGVHAHALGIAAALAVAVGAALITIGLVLRGPETLAEQARVFRGCFARRCPTCHS